MTYYFFLVLALSVDTFIASLSYESDKIKIPVSSNLIISFICSFSLIISLCLGNLISNIINIYILKWLSFFILFTIGIVKLFNSFIKNIINKTFLFTFKNINFVIEIYGDYKKADFDKSKTLSKKEAIFLGLALSIDSLASGLAFQVNFKTVLIIFILSILINFLSVFAAKIIKKINFNISLIGGIIFIILAFLKI